MTELRFNSSSQNEKSKRRRQDHFDKGIKSSSSIDQGWKIARIDTEELESTPCGMRGALSSCEDFSASVEVMAQNTNSGRFHSEGDLFILVMDGQLKVERFLPDGTREERDIFPKMTMLISSGEIFSISSLGWSQFIRIESKNFTKSERLTDPIETISNTAELISPIPIRAAQVSALKSQESVNEHKRSIARMVAGDREKNRSNKVVVKRVNAAGIPID